MMGAEITRETEVTKRHLKETYERLKLMGKTPEELGMFLNECIDKENLYYVFTYTAEMIELLQISREDWSKMKIGEWMS